MAIKIPIRAPHHKKTLGYVYIHTKNDEPLIDKLDMSFVCKTCGQLHNTDLGSFQLHNFVWVKK